jgi:hypothetical protein
LTQLAPGKKTKKLFGFKIVDEGGLFKSLDQCLLSGAMELSQYLEKNKLTQAEFARRLGVAPSYVSMLLAKTFWPGRGLMRAIIKETNGQVTPNDLIDVDVKTYRRKGK